jgi:zinc transport system substrate-binding protein
MRASVTALTAAMMAALAFGCGQADTGGAGKIKVFAGITPQKYFVDRIADGHVETEVLLPPGRTEHTYEPTPQQMTALGGAKLYFEMGLPFEDKILAKASAMYPDLKVVDTRKGITLLPMTESDTDEPKEEAAAEGGLDPHIWLDPALVKVQARTIADALEGIDPAHAGDYEKNLVAFDADLDAADARIRKALAPLKNREFLVFHPAFGYFARAYDLRQIPVEILGKEPSARQLTGIIDRAKKDNIRVVFVQPQFSQKSAEAIAEAIHGAVIPLDALAYDYIRNLEDIANKIDKALTEEG